MKVSTYTNLKEMRDAPGARDGFAGSLYRGPQDHNHLQDRSSENEQSSQSRISGRRVSV